MFVASQLCGRCPDADVAVSALRPRADGDSLVEDMQVVASPIQELRAVLAVDWEFGERTEWSDPSPGLGVGSLIDTFALFGIGKGQQATTNDQEILIECSSPEPSAGMVAWVS